MSRYRMPYRTRTYRRRGRRPRLGEALVRAAVLAALTYTAIAWATDLNKSAAVAAAGVVAGWVLRGKTRIPYLHFGWRRMR